MSEQEIAEMRDGIENCCEVVRAECARTEARITKGESTRQQRAVLNCLKRSLFELENVRLMLWQ